MYTLELNYAQESMQYSQNSYWDVNHGSIIKQDLKLYNFPTVALLNLKKSEALFPYSGILKPVSKAVFQKKSKILSCFPAKSLLNN